MPRTSRNGITCLAVAVAVLTGSAIGSAQTPGTWTIPHDEGVLITTLGADTIAVEQFMIHGNTLETTVITRSPRTVLRTLRLAWDDDGTLRSYEATDRVPGAPVDSIRARVTFTVRDDSVFWTSTAGGQTRTMTQPAINPRVIFVPPMVAPYMMVARIAAIRGDSVASMVTQAGPMELRVNRPEVTWISFTQPELGTIRLRVDDQLRTQEIDTRASTLGSHAVRIGSIDLDALALEFAARDAAGRGLGILSPPDTVRTRVGEANVTIAYHRPFQRGRVIFGNVVPWGQVWRTGANQATGFTTDRDLLIGGTRVPAGSYTIWSLPTENEWHLILNRQTGQWGTQYNAAQDLAHIPMRVETLASPVDQFTIVVNPDGTLSFAWGGRRGTVPIVVAP